MDVVVASDILLYAEQYDSLVASLLQLFRHSHETKLAISTDRSSGSRAYRDGASELMLTEKGSLIGEEVQAVPMGGDRS